MSYIPTPVPMHFWYVLIRHIQRDVSNGFVYIFSFFRTATISNFTSEF